MPNMVNNCYIFSNLEQEAILKCQISWREGELLLKAVPADGVLEKARCFIAEKHTWKNPINRAHAYKTTSFFFF